MAFRLSSFDCYRRNTRNAILWIVPSVLYHDIPTVRQGHSKTWLLRLAHSLKGTDDVVEAQKLPQSFIKTYLILANEQAANLYINDVSIEEANPRGSDALCRDFPPAERERRPATLPRTAKPPIRPRDGRGRSDRTERYSDSWCLLIDRLSARRDHCRFNSALSANTSSAPAHALLPPPTLHARPAQCAQGDTCPLKSYVFR
jgi:hypothetical protein